MHTARGEDEYGDICGLLTQIDDLLDRLLMILLQERLHRPDLPLALVDVSSELADLLRKPFQIGLRIVQKNAQRRPGLVDRGD